MSVEYGPVALAYQALLRAMKSGSDVRTAAIRCMEADLADGTNYERRETQNIFIPDFSYIGAALLAGWGDRIAASVWRILRSHAESHNKRLMREIPEVELERVDWFAVGWLRILERDWRPMPTVPARINHHDLVSELLAAASLRDSSRIEAAVSAIEKRDGKPSILAYALRRELLASSVSAAPPVSLEGAFYAEDAQGAGLSRRRLPQVVERSQAVLPGPDGGPQDYLVERLRCGHRRLETLGSAHEAERRLCLICSATP